MSTGNFQGDGKTANDLDAVALGGFNGTTWDRLRVDADKNLLVKTPAGSTASPGINRVQDGTSTALAAVAPLSADAQSDALNKVVTAGFLWGFNGTTWDRLRTAAAAVLANFSSLGALLVQNPGEWAASHNPSANVVATISRAAGAAGVRHICKSITASISSSALLAGASVVTLVLRDGATGAGTILWQTNLSLSTTAGVTDRIALSGLNIVGSAATAMTPEFTAAGGASTLETVSLAGTDAS